MIQEKLIKEPVKKDPIIISHEQKTYRQYENKVVKAFEPVDLGIPEQQPYFEWTGALIPLLMFQQLLSFCRWSQEEFKSEALIYLFYHIKERRWDAWAPPQETAGMTVKSLPEHKDWAEQRAVFKGMTIMGTLHHHCNSSAFASATDDADETAKDGVHFTIGFCEKPTLDSHVRALFRQIKYNCDLLEWIETPEELKTFELPKSLQKNSVWKAIQNQIENNILTYEPKDNFPEFWKANIHKRTVVRTTYTTPYTGKYAPNQKSLWPERTPPQKDAANFMNGETTTDVIEFVDSPEGITILTAMAPEMMKLRQKWFRGVPKQAFLEKMAKFAISYVQDLTAEEQQCYAEYEKVWLKYDIPIMDQDDFLEILA